MRYRLLPYIYSLAWKVTNDSYTIMRGLPMDFASDANTYNISDQFMFGPSLMACPVTEFMYHRPPGKSVLISSDHYRTDKGETGLLARYYKDPDYINLSKEKIDTNINVFWYDGRPDYVTDSTYAIRWEGKLIPSETGLHQFHLKSFDTKRIYLDGKEVKMVYTSTEQYSEKLELKEGEEYDLVVEVENRSTGAARMQLFWKTPADFNREKLPVETDETRKVYLPAGTNWHDFWTGEKLEGGREITAVASIDTMPLYVKAGSILPMGPFLQYSTEKPADTIELRIYPGANGSFTLYEDENDNYNYTDGMYSTIEFEWSDKDRILKIGERKGKGFPGMLGNRTFRIVMVSKGHGTGLSVCENADMTVEYSGMEMSLEL